VEILTERKIHFGVIAMGKEIERKFLVQGDAWRKLAKGTHYRQGYLSTVKERTVRVRTIDDQSFLTIKGISVGASRSEYEYEIPVVDANAMLDHLCERPLIEKFRYKIADQGHTWEIDEFEGENQGLIVAEIELGAENESFNIPEWIGKEVTGDPKYFNSNLIKNPYSRW
jgi:CYTH domain-containing protein